MNYTKSTILWALMLPVVLLLSITSYHTIQQISRVFGSRTSETCQGSVAMSTSDEDQYSLAYRESLGFFDDITQDEWEMLRIITLGRVNNIDPRNPLLKRLQAPTWYQTNWDPDFSCRHDTKVGIGDGGKVCVARVFSILFCPSCYVAVGCDAMSVA